MYKRKKKALYNTKRFIVITNVRGGEGVDSCGEKLLFSPQDILILTVAIEAEKKSIKFGRDKRKENLREDHKALNYFYIYFTFFFSYFYIFISKT